MYCIDPNSDEPIMLLNKQIGQTYNQDGTPDGEPFVDGALFQEELLWLDTMGKKRIQVWINSPGGSIIHAMNIFSAISKSKTPCDTYNIGLCASSAGAVFMAGRKRYMCDFAQFMMHPVSGTQDEKAQLAFKESCVNMLSGKADLPKATITYMMDLTTWIGLSDCLQYGIATDAEFTKDANKKYMPNDAKALYAYSNNILNEKISNLKPIIMDFSKITNKLNLVDGANQDTIISAINALEEKCTTAVNSLAEAETKVTNLSNQLEEAKAQLQSAKEAQEQAEKDALELDATNKATEMVNSFKAKLGNDLTKWVNLAKADFEGTKSLIESIPLNKVANTIETDNNTTVGKITAQSVMATIQNKFKNK